MKREYTTPSVYVELFTPNQYAGNCQPGISEKDLAPTYVDCMWNGKTANRKLYNFAPNSCKKASDQDISGCSKNGETLSLLTNKCQVDFSGDSTYGSGVDVKYAVISGGNLSFNGAVYSWPNGNPGGTHQAKAVDVIPNQSYDSDGRPYYFNS